MSAQGPGFGTPPVFSNLIHSPVRLRVCSLLRPAQELEFSTIRDVLGLSDANLSKNLKVLADEGVVVLRKERSPAREDARRLTWVALTPQGRGVVEGHLAALIEIADGGAGM